MAVLGFFAGVCSSFISSSSMIIMSDEGIEDCDSIGGKCLFCGPEGSTGLGIVLEGDEGSASLPREKAIEDA